MTRVADARSAVLHPSRHGRGAADLVEPSERGCRSRPPCAPARLPPPAAAPCHWPSKPPERSEPAAPQLPVAVSQGQRSDRRPAPASNRKRHRASFVSPRLGSGPARGRQRAAHGGRPPAVVPRPSAIADSPTEIAEGRCWAMRVPGRGSGTLGCLRRTRPRPAATASSVASPSSS